MEWSVMLTAVTEKTNGCLLKLPKLLASTTTSLTARRTTSIRGWEAVQDSKLKLRPTACGGGVYAVLLPFQCSAASLREVRVIVEEGRHDCKMPLLFKKKPTKGDSTATYWAAGASARDGRSRGMNELEWQRKEQPDLICGKGTNVETPLAGNVSKC